MSMADTTASAPDLLVIGGSGFLGRQLIEHAAIRQLDLHATGHQHPNGPYGQWHQLDLSDGGGAAAALIAFLRPRAIINAAYVNAGDDLTAVTADAPGTIAAAAAGTGARLVHVSSDVVFDGEKEGAYVEGDLPAPVHAYGHAKAAAENAVAAADHTAVIVRTSLLWSLEPDGGAQVRLVRDPEVRFFTDEVRNPLRVDRLSVAIHELVRRADITGPIHLAGADAVDRLTLARALAPLARRAPEEIRGAPSHQKAAAARPRRLALDTTLARSLLDAPLPGIVADAPTREHAPND
jgi:dTDP-4-dehydrorhamnose reductase